MAGKNIVQPARSAFDGPADDSPTMDAFNEHIQPAPGASWKKSNAEIISQLSQELDTLKEQIATQSVSAIIPVDGVYHAGRFDLTLTSMTAPEDVTEKELSLFTGFLRSIVKAYRFWAGDLANLYYERHGMMPEELALLLDVEIRTLEGWARVCSRIPHVMRITSLDFTHHLEVAFLPSKLEGQEGSILGHAEKFDLSTRELKEYIRELNRDGKPPRYIPVDNLFSKDRTPGLMQLRRIYREAAKGDKSAREQIKVAIQSYRDWLLDIEKNLNIK